MAIAATMTSQENNSKADDHHHYHDHHGHDHDMVMPGFRFHPTEEELIEFYLRRKVEGKRFNVELITFLDLYRYDPWELPGSFSLPAPLFLSLKPLLQFFLFQSLVKLSYIYGNWFSESSNMSNGFQMGLIYLISV